MRVGSPAGWLPTPFPQGHDPTGPQANDVAFIGPVATAAASGRYSILPPELPESTILNLQYYSMRSKREFAKTNIQRSSRIVFRVGPDLDRAKDEPSTREKARAKRAY